DREIVEHLAGAPSILPAAPASPPLALPLVPARPELSHAKAADLLPLLCASGRFFLLRPQGRPGAEPLAADEGAPWDLDLAVDAQEGGGYALSGCLRRGEERLPLAAPDLVLRAGFVIASGQVGRLADPEAFAWISPLRAQGVLRYATGEEEKLFQ